MPPCPRACRGGWVPPRPALPGGGTESTPARAAGRTPTIVVGTEGTTNTGAVDPLVGLADLCAAEGLWFHVDGAYGAFGVLDPAIADR